MGDLGPVFSRIVNLHFCPLKCCENWWFSSRPFFVKTHYFRMQTSRICYPHLWTIKLRKNFGKILQNKKVINGRPRTSFQSERHFTLQPHEVLWKSRTVVPLLRHSLALWDWEWGRMASSTERKKRVWWSHKSRMRMQMRKRFSGK